MSLRKLTGETLVYGLSSVLGRLLNFVLVTYFITRLMSSEEFGVVGDLMYWTAVLISLLVFRMDTALFRFASRPEYDAAAVFSRTQRFVTAAVVVVIGAALLLADQLAEALKYPDRVVYVYLVLATVALDALAAVPLARLRLAERAWFFVAVNLGNVVCNIFFIYLLLYVLPERGGLFGLEYRENYRVGYYLGSVALASLLRYLALVTDGLLRGRERKGPASRTPAWSELLAYSYPLTLVAVAGIFNALSGPWLLKEWGNGNATENLYWAGQFSAALKLAVLLNLFVTAYNYAAEPFFFRQAGRDVATADKSLYADAARAYSLVATLACAGILLLLPWLERFIDEGERVGLDALPLLLAANFLFGLFANFSVAYKLTDRTLLGGGIATAGSLLLTVVVYRTIATSNHLAPAWGMLACYGLMCALAYLVSRRYFPVNYPLGRILLYVVLAVATVYVGGLWEGMAWRIVCLFSLLLALVGLEFGWVRRTFRQ